MGLVVLFAFMVVHPLKHIPEMFETAEWDDDDDGPQLSALGQAAARREDEKSKDTGSTEVGKVKKQKEKTKKVKVKRKSTEDLDNSGRDCERDIGKDGVAPEKVDSSIGELPEKIKDKKKRKEKKNSALSEISRKVLNSIDSTVSSPGQEEALLENQQHDESEVGSILKKGIKFSSAEAFLRFIGLPGKSKRGKKRALEEEKEGEDKKHKKEKKGKTEPDEEMAEEKASDEEGEENMAFKAETPVVKDSSLKALNMARLKEHLNTQDSKAKEEDAAETQTKKATTDSPLTLSAKQKLTASRSGCCPVFEFYNITFLWPDSGSSMSNSTAKRAQLVPPCSRMTQLYLKAIMLGKYNAIFLCHFHSKSSGIESRLTSGLWTHWT